MRYVRKFFHKIFDSVKANALIIHFPNFGGAEISANPQNNPTLRRSKKGKKAEKTKRS